MILNIAEDAMEFANQIFSSGEVLSVTLVSASDPDNLVCHATATEKDLQMVMDDLAKTYSSGELRFISTEAYTLGPALALINEIVNFH